MRANIIIKEGDAELWFYRHSDGYPDRMMPILEKFMERVKAGTYRSTSHCVGHLRFMMSGRLERSAGKHSEFVYMIDLVKKTVMWIEADQWET